ncbi:hypothetical protein R69746_05640 [Paraburkholderia aspalathi]|uniref:hypothetical protein n=1 Tax=Paraburkholderia aspalathi TaxID=1324617 RepID=UPI001909EDA1|nr:hypothetical protein [Paraburkholderia aspalathi]MBK3841737.1 hypothetical protein [Paraburkholderia aspalathi]CAE6811468.1 hypothetical protein R69746_05640 [Paraburkholderia aspalathi]
MMRNPYGLPGLGGIDVQVSPLCDDVQRMHVSPAFAHLMPHEFVDDLNTWMLKFFGRHDVSYVIDNGRTLVVGPKTLEKLKAAA